MALADAARQAGLPLVEAFMYRFHPQTAALLDLIRDGVIGDVTHVDASFAFRTGERTGRLFDADTAGGGILDVGGYPVTMAAAIVQAATGVAVAEPVDLTATGTLGPTGRRRVDGRAAHLHRAGSPRRSAPASACRTTTP